MDSVEVDSGLAALAEPTRRAIVERLAEGERCVCDLQEGLGVAQSRLSFHLKKLKDARLVSARRQGRWVYYDLSQEGLAALAGWIGSIAARCVRRAEPGDLSGMLRLLEECHLPTAGVAALVDGPHAGRLGSAWVSGGTGALEAMAALEVHGEAGLLRSVAVAPAARGQGRGGLMVERALREAACIGCGAVYLLTTTAEPWFRERGFASVSRDAVPPAVRESDEFSHICPSSAVVMSRRVERVP